MLAPEDVSEKAIVLLKDTFTNLGPRLQTSNVEIHEDFIQTTMDRLKVWDTRSVAKILSLKLAAFVLELLCN